MSVFTEGLLLTVQNLIVQHHTVYPTLPPQGVFFEALMQRAFHLSGSPDAQIVSSTPNAPTFDLVAANERISVKTETGKGTHATLINITKLCTTEREPWTANVLVERVLEHLSRYDHMIMLRAIWLPDRFRYQLVDIPLGTLRRIGTAALSEVGRRKGRRSLGGDVLDGDKVVFHVHFDGSDGKCQVRNLPTNRCVMLREWEQRV